VLGEDAYQAKEGRARGESMAALGLFGEDERGITPFRPKGYPHERKGRRVCSWAAGPCRKDVFEEHGWRMRGWSRGDDKASGR